MQLRNANANYNNTSNSAAPPSIETAKLRLYVRRALSLAPVDGLFVLLRATCFLGSDATFTPDDDMNAGTIYHLQK